MTKLVSGMPLAQGSCEISMGIRKHIEAAETIDSV